MERVCFQSGNRRGILFGCKVLGTYVGHSDYVEANIDTKIPKLQHVAEVLLKYPYQQGRFLLHTYSFNPRINYLLRTHFPEHAAPLVETFKELQFKLIASYSGNFYEEGVPVDPWFRAYLLTRAALKIKEGGLSLGSWDATHAAAFLSSLVASIPHLAKVFPSWANLDRNGKIVSISDERYPYITDQIMQVVNYINQQAPQGPLRGMSSLTAIFQKLYVNDDNNQIADQLQLHEIPPEVSYGLSPSSSRKQTAQKIICDHLRISILARFKQILKEESEQAGHGSTQQLRYRYYLSCCNSTSGLWMRPSMFSIIQRLSNEEFRAAFCKFMTLENPSIPKQSPQLQLGENEVFQCTCNQNMGVDSFGYHWLACTVRGLALIMHHNMTHLLVTLFRSIGLVVILEPLHLFENIQDEDNRRPDILISNPYGGGPQIILDVAVTGVNGQSRRSDTETDQPLEYRCKQKKDKYTQVAQDNGYRFIPAIFSHTGQIHKDVMDLMSDQIKHKLQLDDHQVQSSKIKGMLNLWVKQLSCVINRTAARNIIAGKAALVDAVNASSNDDRTSTQRDDQLAANSSAAHNFIEDLDLSLINQDHRQH